MLSQVNMVERRSAAQESDEDAIFRGNRSRKTGKRGRPKGSGVKTSFSIVKLSPPLAKLMGSANTCYVQKEYEKAIGLLSEIIRQEPNSAEPFRLLGIIYGEMGDDEKSRAFLLIAAHLSPGDAELWRIVADKSR